MKSPRLNRLALFERKSVTQNSYGDDVVTWVALAYLPGSPAVAEKFQVELQDVMPSRAEGIQSGVVVARNQTRLRMRWRGDVDSTQRVTVYGEGEQVYQIIGGPAAVGGRKNYLELMLETYSPAGGGL